MDSIPFFGIHSWYWW